MLNWIKSLDQSKRVAGIYVTYRCDLDCPGCNSAGFIKYPTIPELTLLKFNRLLDQIESLGFFKYLEILGGEPTLHSKCLDFMQLAIARNFRVVIWSNAYSPLAKSVLATVRRKRIGGISYITQKPNGSQKNFLSFGCNTKTIYCSPADCGIERVGCNWLRCGYSINELGITACNIGGLIAHYTCPKAYTQSLSDFLNPGWIERSFRLLCRHCGAFLDNELKDRPEVSDVNGTLMTQTWINAFGF